ncbi:wolframin isoform X3 [Anthonomus grandis grandis]|uniref:wolframin isoform X3 n=1 Tax=Anthonomus grandis grandis TaxID=2921223 RepID=UPI00216570C5|nr:wolframin isoform X3 [Anthonomus grandis grandis]
MAGIIPNKSSSGRKQWRIHAGQRTSLKRLRTQMASDGCPESQVVLAKQLLEEECEFKQEQRENAKLGVYWLLKASYQGNLEATDLLKSCLETGKGISEQNYIDVKACISMTQDEKIVRRAAKEVFASLSNGGEYITSNQLQRKILSIDRSESSSSKSTKQRNFEDSDEIDSGIMNNFDDISESEDEELDWSQISDVSNEKLTEDKVVAAAITFSRGELPVVNNSLCLSEPNLKALDHIPFVYWSILHPILCLKIIYFKIIRCLGKRSIPLPLARSEFQYLLIFLLYSLVSISHLEFFIPTIFFYLSFIFMVLSTFQVLQYQREFYDFCLWRGLFICYSNGDLNERSFETQFILNHSKQFVWFFSNLIIHYFVYSLTPLKLESEFGVVACALMFMTLIGSMPKRRGSIILDSLLLLSFAVNVLARYPYDTDPIVSQGWRYLELTFPSFPSYIIGNGIEFCITFRLLLYATIPVILLRLAIRENWRGTYKTVLPHLVTLSWLQYFAVCSNNATMFGLLRATLALVGSVLFLPLVGIMSVILPVAAVTQWIVTSNIFYTISLFLILLALSFLVCFICARTKYAQYTAIVQVILMVLAFFALVRSSDRMNNLTGHFDMKVEPKLLEWDVFQRACYQGVWEGTESSAKAQSRCLSLEGTQVFWEGSVSSVEILSITNTYKRWIDMFPKFMADWLYCYYGSKLSCHEDDMSCASLLESSTNKCTLKKYDVYTLQTTIKMASSSWRITPEIKLFLTNEFKNFTLGLLPKDSIWFKGSLFNDYSIIGSLNTHLKVEEIGCIVCSDIELMPVKLSKGVNFQFFAKARDGIKFVLNVMFNPVLIFK